MKARNWKSYALDENGLGLVLFFDFLGHLFRSVLAGIVVYGQVTTLGGEFVGYKCPQAPRNLGGSTSASDATAHVTE